MPAINTKYPNEIGNKNFQPNRISWSYRYLGNTARTQTNKNIINIDFRAKIQTPKSIIKSHPPKNNNTFSDDISIMFEYSPKKNNANPIDEYSTLYPLTSSASASGKSNGGRFVSAKLDIKNIINAGNNGNTYHTYFCASTISVKFNEPLKISTNININPIEISYAIIWAVDLNDPKKAYFELLDHPDKTIP